MYFYGLIVGGGHQLGFQPVGPEFISQSSLIKLDGCFIHHLIAMVTACPNQPIRCRNTEHKALIHPPPLYVFLLIRIPFVS